VHYDPRYNDLIKEHASTAQYPVRILNDDQAFLVQDQKITFLGPGEEITHIQLD
jgi:hypothetical protein